MNNKEKKEYPHRLHASTELPKDSEFKLDLKAAAPNFLEESPKLKFEK